MPNLVHFSRYFTAMKLQCQLLYTTAFFRPPFIAASRLPLARVIFDQPLIYSNCALLMRGSHQTLLLQLSWALAAMLIKLFHGLVIYRHPKWSRPSKNALNCVTLTEPSCFNLKPHQNLCRKLTSLTLFVPV